MKDRAQIIRDTVSDLISNLLYYDRKEDQELPPGAIQEAIVKGEISLDEIVCMFREYIQRNLPEDPTTTTEDKGE